MTRSYAAVIIVFALTHSAALEASARPPIPAPASTHWSGADASAEIVLAQLPRDAARRPIRPSRPGLRPVRPGDHVVRPARRPIVIVRPWRHRPHFGRIVAGVALGTIITVAVAGAVPRSPASNLCWYWSDQSEITGYWDYCR